MKRNRRIFVFICIFGMFFCSCGKTEKIAETSMEQREKLSDEAAEDSVEEIEKLDHSEQVTESGSDIEKGYDLPVPDKERSEAYRASYQLMKKCADLYMNAEKNNLYDHLLDRASARKMILLIGRMGYPVISSGVYPNMKNYRKVERFLSYAEAGRKGSVVLYKIDSDGNLGREKYVFDGEEMYLLVSYTTWENQKPCMTYISYTKIKEWRYSKKGWFCYELCVPEYPEVTEMMDGGVLIRIKPISRRKRRLSKQCVLGLGYQGNNLLCSDWDTGHLSTLDYNGLYEYFYEMKYKKKYDPKQYPKGIPKEKFEDLIMEYLPVTSKLIQKYAVYDKKHKTYSWIRLGCFNYSPSFFGTSVPEVRRIKKNKNGTVTLTVDAVCEMILHDEAVITHELTVQFAPDGSFRYLGNKILNHGIKEIPEYEYRFGQNARLSK